MSSAPELPFAFYSDRAETHRTANRLPHLEQSNRAYFITFRLADSLPRSFLDEWEAARDAWLAWHPQPWSAADDEEYHQRFTRKIERTLDEGYGSCALRQPEHADIVGKALAFFEGERYRQLSWVVMPNHVHLLCVPIKGWTLAALLHSWKSFTANEIHRAMQTSGSLWQKDYFDRMIRDAEHFGRAVRYIRENPRKAHLSQGQFLLWEGTEAQVVG